MIDDSTRMSARDRAIRRLVRPGQVVLDGDPTAREPSLRYLVCCLIRLGHSEEATDALERYRASFGPYPFVQEG